MPIGTKKLQGALIEFSERFIGPVPNVIIFQYNPETLARTLDIWTPPEPPGDEPQPEVKPGAPTQSQPGDPVETFTLELELDATDALEDPGSHPVAVISGVADRIAAMEMLLYPQPDESLLGGLLGNLSASLSVGAGGVSAGGGAAAQAAKARAAPKEVPVVLFVWGPGRIVPVRLTSFAVDEQAFLPTLYPMRAKVSIGLRIVDGKEFEGATSFSKKLAKAAYDFTRTQKQVLAAANLANGVESILGMLPF